VQRKIADLERLRAFVESTRFGEGGSPNGSAA